MHCEIFIVALKARIVAVAAISRRKCSEKAKELQNITIIVSIA